MRLETGPILIYAVSAVEQIPGTDGGALIVVTCDRGLASSYRFRGSAGELGDHPLSPSNGAPAKSVTPAASLFTGIRGEVPLQLESQMYEKRLKGDDVGFRTAWSRVRAASDPQPGGRKSRVSDAGIERGAAAETLRIFPDAKSRSLHPR